MQDLMMMVSGRPDFWLSMLVILCVLVMAGFFIVYFLRKIREDTAAQAALQSRPEGRPGG